MQWAQGRFLIVIPLACALTSIGLGDGFELRWSTLDGGGVMNSTGRNFELSGTIGQPDASGPLTSRSFELTGGFWFGVSPGDCNSDGGVDLHDHGDFEACMAGPRIEPPCESYPCFDRDGDRDVDLADYAILQWMQAGP